MLANILRMVSERDRSFSQKIYESNLIYSLSIIHLRII